jgi:hypothetical protein
MNIFYQCQLTNLDFIASDECVDIQYFDLGSIQNLDLTNELKAFLLEYKA